MAEEEVSARYARWRGVARIARWVGLFGWIIVAGSFVVGYVIAIDGFEDFDAVFWTGVAAFIGSCAQGLFMVMIARYVGARAKEYQRDGD